MNIFSTNGLLAIIVPGIVIFSVLITFYFEDDILFNWSCKKVRIIKFTKDGKICFKIYERFWWFFLQGYGSDYYTFEYDSYEEAYKDYLEIINSKPEKKETIL